MDCANGAASSIAKTVFEMLGAKTYVIHNEPNGLNINVDCGSTHIESLQKYVAENNLDIGFAFDGDADRCFAVDEKGNVVGRRPDYVYLCLQNERRRHPSEGYGCSYGYEQLRHGKMSWKRRYPFAQNPRWEINCFHGDYEKWLQHRRRTIRAHHFQQIQHYGRRYSYSH